MAEITPWTPVNGNVLSDLELLALTHANKHTGVVSGCNVAAAGTPNKTVIVDAGVVVIDGVITTCAGATVDLTSTIDPTNPKIAVIYIDTSGIPQIHAGTAAAIVPAGTSEANWKQWEEPYAATSSIPTGAILAKVKLSAAETDIAAADIYSVAQKVIVPLKYAIVFRFSGSGAVLGTGVCPGVEVPVAGHIVSARLMSCDATSGSIAVGVWKDTYANSPPTVADLIDTFSITTATKSEETGLTLDVAVGDWLVPNIDSVTSLKEVTLSLMIEVS